MKGQRSDWLPSAPVTATNSKADTPLFPFLARLIRGEDLTAEESAAFFDAMTDAKADQIQIAGALTALTAKGETFEELAGMAATMRRNAVGVTSTQKNVVDIAGTGSSAARTFNVSTGAAFVAAGAGLNIAKQCNRGVLTRMGSADVLTALGVKLAAEPGAARSSLNGVGLCFMFAPNFHPTLRRLGEVRRNLGIRTCLNVLGPLANPAGISRQLVGVWHRSLLNPVAKALSQLKTEMAWVVHGEDGLDELTISGKTHIVQVVDEHTREFSLTPKDFGLKPGKIDHLAAGSGKESAAIILDVLSSRRRDEARSLMVINAAAALIVGKVATDPMHAARLAEQSIDSGQAENKLQRLIQITNKK